MAGPDYMLTDFLTFLPTQKSLPPSLRPTVGLFGGNSDSIGLIAACHAACTPIARIFDESGQRQPACQARTVQAILVPLSNARPPQRKRGAPICASIDLPPPNQLPATLVCTSFAEFYTPFFAMRPDKALYSIFI